MKYLVKEKGADVNKENNNGQTPLFSVCTYGNSEIVKYLVEHGANVNKADKDGKTPLFDACWDGNLEIVKYLAEHGAQ